MPFSTPAPSTKLVRISTRIGLAVFLALCACKPPPTVEEVAEQTGNNVSNLLQEAWDAAAVSVNGSAPIEKLRAAVNLSAKDVGGGGVEKPSVPTRNTNETTFSDFQKFLKERVFVKDNIENTNGDAITFLVNGKRFCTDPVSGSSNADCEKTIDDLKLRVVAQGDPNATLTLRFEVGTDRVSPLTLTIEKDKALQIDARLAEYFQAAKTLSATNPNVPVVVPQTTTNTLSGDVRLRLEKLGPQRFALTSDITKDVAYEFIGSDGFVRTVAIGQSSPSARLEYDGLAGTHDFKSNIGKVTVRVPYGDVNSNKTDTTVLGFDFEGASLEVTDAVSGALGSAKLTVRPGTNRVTYGGTEVFSLVPPQAITAKLVADADGRLKVALNEFETTANFALRSLPNQSASEAFSDESYKVSLKGPNPAVRLAKVGNDTAVKFLDSTFEIRALKANRAVSVPANQCLSRNVSPVSSDPELLRSVAASSCE